jgi:hypothetical protein
MPIMTSINSKKSPKSKIKRLSFLPRFGFTIDFLGYQFNYKQAPIIETLINIKKSKGRGIIAVSKDQFNEIKLHNN